jgi:hypothetical protein
VTAGLIDGADGAFISRRAFNRIHTSAYLEQLCMQSQHNYTWISTLHAIEAFGIEGLPGPVEPIGHEDSVGLSVSVFRISATI